MTAAPDRLAARRRRDDAGLSLVELMVSASIGLIVLSGVAAVFSAMARTAHTVSISSPSAAGVRLASEALSRELRVAVKPRGVPSALVSATTTGVSFYALLNRSGSAATTDMVPTLVTYSHSSNCLRVTKTPGVPRATPPMGGPDYDWPATGAVTRCLLRTTTAPSFAYYATTLIATDASSNVTDTANALTVPGSGLDAAALKTVQSVQVTVTGRSPDDPAVAATTVKTRVSLVNLLTTT